MATSEVNSLEGQIFVTNNPRMTGLWQNSWGVVKDHHLHIYANRHKKGDPLTSIYLPGVLVKNIDHENAISLKSDDTLVGIIRPLIDFEEWLRVLDKVSRDRSIKENMLSWLKKSRSSDKTQAVKDFTHGLLENTRNLMKTGMQGNKVATVKRSQSMKQDSTFSRISFRKKFSKDAEFGQPREAIPEEAVKKKVLTPPAIGGMNDFLEVDLTDESISDTD